MKNLNLTKLSDSELVKLQGHRNEWFVRHARRILQERAAGGNLNPKTHDALFDLLNKSSDTPMKLRALWALYATGGPVEPALDKFLSARPEQLRWWAVQLLCEGGRLSPARTRKFEQMARDDESPLVRLALASALQRLPLAERWGIARELVKHESDARDQNLPLMIWYGVEPLVPADRARAIQLMGGAGSN